MVDRLAELKSGAASRASMMGSANPVGEQPLPAAPGSADIEAGNSAGQPAFMSRFFTNVDLVKSDIKEVKAACKKIVAANQRMTMATSSEEEASCSAALNAALAPANRSATRAKETIEAMLAETNKLKAENKQANVNEIRIRENLMSTLSRKLAEAVKELQQQKQNYKDDVKKKVARQVRIVKEDATEEEIDAVMATGGAEQLLEKAILSTSTLHTANDAVREVFEQAQDKFRDVLKLEQSVLELNQMMTDFALVVEQQGELLDQIEYNVHAAHEFVEGGNKDIEVAIDYQKSIRKKQCCILITVLILAVVLMAVLGVFNGSGARRRLTEALAGEGGYELESVEAGWLLSGPEGRQLKENGGELLSLSFPAQTQLEHRGYLRAAQ